MQLAELREYALKGFALPFASCRRGGTNCIPGFRAKYMQIIFRDLSNFEQSPGIPAL
jgi:hypothetical protein